MIDDRQLDDRIRDLPRSIDPPTDAWPQLAAQIRARAARRRRVPIGVAIAAAVAGGVWWGAGRMPRPADLQPALADAPQVLAVPVVVPTPAPAPELIPGEGELERAATELARAYDRRRPLLDRELLAVYEENLDIVDAAIERSRAALVERPDDPHLQQVLGRAYHHKLALLRSLPSPEGTP